MVHVEGDDRGSGRDPSSRNGRLTVRGTPLPFLPGRALSLVIGLSRDRPTGTVTTRAIATGGRTGSVSVSVSVCVRAELKSETVARRDYARPGPAGPLMVDCSSLFLSAAARQGCGRVAGPVYFTCGTRATIFFHA